MIINGIHIPIFDLFVVFFCAATVEEILDDPVKFGLKVHRTPRKQRKWNWLNWLCMVPMQQWLHAIFIIFAITVIWELLVMPYMGIAMIIQFISSLACTIMLALILKKNKDTEKATFLLVSTLCTCAVWVEIVVTAIGL